MVLLTWIVIEDFDPLPKILDPAWVGRYIAPIRTRIIDAQGVKMEIWAWLLVAFVLASLVLVARNI